MDTKGFINPLWLLVGLVIVVGAGAAWWVIQQGAPQEWAQVELPIIEDTKPLTQEAQLSKTLANVTPEIVVTERLSPERYKQVEKDIISILVPKGLYDIQFGKGLMFYAVGKRYVMFTVSMGKDCSGSAYIIDAVTGSLTEVNPPLIVRESSIVSISDSAFYIYAPDAPEPEEVVGSRIAPTEVFVPEDGLAGVCGIPKYTEYGSSITVDVATPRGGTDPETGDPLLGSARKLTFTLPQ